MVISEAPLDHWASDWTSGPSYADLEVFEATADAATMPPKSVLEATMPAFEALCDQAQWGMQGVLIRSLRKFRAGPRPTDAPMSILRTSRAIRTRAAAFEALNGKHIDLP